GPEPYPQNAHSRYTPHLRMSVVRSFVSPAPLRPCVAYPCVSNRWSTAMNERDVPACVYALANCLDAILASCEDLQSTTPEPSTLFPLERAAVAHVLQARQHIREFDPFHPGLVHGCAHFLVATNQLATHWQPDNLHPASTTQQRLLPLADDHLIGGQVHLCVLAYEAGKLLDALETHFLLYDDHYDDEQLPEGEPLAYWATVAEPPNGKWWRWPRESHRAR